ncbi:MAG: prolyl oligopeptidase family serine peptidase [Candidatus Omnitrophica bacterium]|nr:prolyl oligopeptidase family serine peptidase [Candidatus Omnitrophota bacterium]
MHIGRTRFRRQILTEFAAPKDKKSGKVVIFCAGVPGAPEKDEVLEYFARKGYWAFFPRYRGCWESHGKFLKHSLEYDVFAVIDAMQKRFKDFWTDKSYRVKPEHITVVGSSFGGPAAILATLDERVDKAVCISPVVDWVAEDKDDPLENLYKLIRKAFGGVYRIDKKNWNRLKDGDFYNPLPHIDKFDKDKIMIFHAEDDTIVKYKPVAKFADKLGCKLTTFEKGGHLSSSLLCSAASFRKVERFLHK